MKITQRRYIEMKDKSINKKHLINSKELGNMKKIAKRVGVYVLAGMMMTGAIAPLSVHASARVPKITIQKKETKKDFYDVLMNAYEPSEVTSYIKTHIAKASQTEIDEYMRGLFSFCDDIREVDFTELKSVSKYLPKDVRAALPLLIKEHKQPSIQDGVSKISLGELLSRSLSYENYLKKYKSGTGAKAIKNLYEETLAFAITGGYHKEMGLPNVYMNDAGTKVDGRARDIYEEFATKHAKTKTGKILVKYEKVLNKSNGKITKSVENFYNNIYNLMK